MMEIVNPTPFVAARNVVLDKTAAEHLIVVLKATFAISERGELGLAEEQQSVRPADEFLDEPGLSSIDHEAELGPPKPATDLFLRGHARARKSGTSSMPVRFRLGKISREAIVFGPRRWSKKLGRAGVSGPEPFGSIPLIWENAFGGADTSAEKPEHHDREARNPVGLGFRTKHSKMDWADTPLPSIEDPGGMLKKPGGRVEPVGFGPVGRDWEPRVGYAGTYDEAWMEQRMPLLPEDFDDRFHNAAPPGLVVPGFVKGGEPVEVVGCTTREKLTFRLPEIEAHAAIRFGDRTEPLRLACETVTVDTDAFQLHLVWKGWLRVHRELLRLRAIEFRVDGELP